MSLSIKRTSTANEIIDVDLARYAQDKEFLYVEYAKILSEDQESAEIEVRSSLRFPIENALDSLMGLMDILMVHENEHKSGHGVSLSKDDDKAGGGEG